jgi:hypothetical protein
VRLTTSEWKILAATPRVGGLAWYDIGVSAYPGSTMLRRNVFGMPFRDLYGRGLSITYRCVNFLKRAGLIYAKRDHRIILTKAGVAMLKKGKP